MLNILLSFHHIKFTDDKNEIYFKILFKRCRDMPLQGHLLAARIENKPILNHFVYDTLEADLTFMGLKMNIFVLY